MLGAKKRTKRAGHKAHTTEAASTSDWVRSVLKGLLVTVAAALLLLLTCSLIVYFNPDPHRLIDPMGLVCAALTAWIGGFATVRFHRHSALICGLLNGTVTTGIVLLISLFFKDASHGYSPLIACLYHSLYILLALAGAYLGLPREKTKKHPRKQ